MRTRYRELLANSPEDLLQLTDRLYGQGFYYRGHLNSDWALETTLERNYDDRRRTIEEARILGEFQRRAHIHLSDLPALDDPIEWLAILAHHGAPTRLLDFTKRVFVAAFFAIAYRQQTSDRKAAAVWAINVGAVSRAASAFVFKHQEKLRRFEGLRGFALSFAGEGVQTELPPTNATIHLPGGWDPFSRSMVLASIQHGMDVPGVFPVHPMKMARRMQTQSAVFLAPTNLAQSFEDNLCAILSDDFRFEVDADPVPLSSQTIADMYSHDAVLKIIIPNASFGKYFHALREMNLDEATLFPDLDGLIQSLLPPAREWGVPWTRTQ